MADSGSAEDKPIKSAKRAPKSLDVRQFTIAPDDDDIRLDRWFKRHMADVPFNIVSRWARTGQLRLDGKRVGPGDRIGAGQIIRVPPAEIERPGRPEKARVDLTPDVIEFAQSLVIHRDEAAIVVNKPPGLATQGGSKTNTHLDGMLDALSYGAETRPRLVHRLDKDTSGVLLLARSAGSAAFFSKRFSGRSARKIYWALVMGVPEISDGMIDLPLAKQPGTGGEKMHVDEEEGAAARTRYRVIEVAGNRASWVELQPFTGRTHQLRVHMAAIGHPIVGDGKYGGKDAFLTGTISRKMHLHARRLIIEHPKAGKLDVRADLPEHFAESMEQLGLDMALGDAMVLIEDRPPPTKTQRKTHARAHAKTVRKARRGERKARADGPAPVRKPVKKGGAPRPGAKSKAGPKPARKPTR
ncbi:MAG: RluA family pseudouridine synthase [Parasphingorhabdus sp.]|nr:RluA family pseudouridine synthase [Parasphingorhabdus sp.]